MIELILKRFLSFLTVFKEFLTLKQIYYPIIKHRIIYLLGKIVIIIILALDLAKTEAVE